jgi:hypothetical protein
MKPEPYSFDMKIDEDGVAVVTAIGRLDAEILLQQRRKLAEDGLTGESISGRPLVIDLRKSDPPNAEWMENYRKIALYLKQTEEYPYRRAYVVAGVHRHDFSIRLLQMIEETEGAPRFETRIFHDYSVARDWAKAGWQPDSDSDTDGCSQLPG